MDDTSLVELAINARDFAYTPYSHFAVGAALLCKDGSVYTGCNIENAAYGPANCAERTAFFKAISEGKKEFSAIAVVGSPAKKPVSQWVTPCGVCRQVMREFCDPKTFRVIIGHADKEPKSYMLEELLPDSFGPEDLHLLD